jgi:transcriptional regulator of arginine metabolism
MQKTKRLLAIEKIISGENIMSQEALLRKLKGKGILCTQATLSRNLRQLGVSRIPDGKGGYRYSLSAKPEPAFSSEVRLNIIPVIREIVEAKGLMVIRTIPGNANATAYHIDNAGRYEIAGTIAGDDTILVIPRDGITLNQVHSCLEIIMPGLHRQIEGTGKNKLSKEKNIKKVISVK